MKIKTDHVADHPSLGQFIMWMLLLVVINLKTKFVILSCTRLEENGAPKFNAGID